MEKTDAELSSFISCVFFPLEAYRDTKIARDTI